MPILRLTYWECYDDGWDTKTQIGAESEIRFVLREIQQKIAQYQCRMIQSNPDWLPDETDPNYPYRNLYIDQIIPWAGAEVMLKDSENIRETELNRLLKVQRIEKKLQKQSLEDAERKLLQTLLDKYGDK